MRCFPCSGSDFSRESRCPYLQGATGPCCHLGSAVHTCIPGASAGQRAECQWGRHRAAALRRRREEVVPKDIASSLRARALLFCVLALSACDRRAAELEYRVLRTLPHDPGAYTQGLVLHEGWLWESTGRYGDSSVRKVRIDTGEIVQIHRLPEQYFGEGLAVVDSQLVQLTWQEGVAFVYDLGSLSPRDTLAYEGEGWGLCYDGQALYMTNGSSTLFRRDARTFEVLDSLEITRDGFPIWNLNELECVGDDIYANVFLRDEILRIDKATGRVRGVLDAWNLVVASRRPADTDAVLNGIAYAASAGTFFVTGKLWPALFELEIEGVDGRR